MDEKDLASKLGNLKTHQATMNFALENFEATYSKFRAILGPSC